MATCKQCGQPVSIWWRDIFTGQCSKCQSEGARPAAQPASLGCGTLLLIAAIVLIFGRAGLGDLDSQMSRLERSVEELKKASDDQTKEIRELRKMVEALRKAGEVGKDK